MTYKDFLKRIGVLLLFAFIGTSTVSAQTIRGTVEDTNGEALPGVNVSVKGTTIGTTTDVDGGYTIELPGGERILVFSFVGFRTLEATVPDGQTRFDVQLEEDVLGLDEVVVTGLATSVKRTNLANAVGTISSKDLVPAPAQTLERALSGKIAGLTVSQNTGAPGGGINVNLRGTSTITGSTQPLYVIDGVIVDNTAIQSGLDLITAATGAGSSTPQGQPTNRIADINPNDIESVEVLKGASAAAIYGSKASNGVVIITTKRGAPGHTAINVTQQVGFTHILHKIGTRKFTPQTAEALTTGGADLLARNGQLDYEDLLYGETGLLNETTASVSGGDNDTRYFISALAQSEDGIVENTGYDKYSGRFNLEQRFGDRLRINVQTQMVRSESDRSITGNENQGSTTLGFAYAFTPPFVDLRPDANGNYPAGPAGSNPLHTIQLLKNNEKVNRGIASGRLSYNLFRTQNQNLDVIVQGGGDFYSAEHKVVSPPELQFEQAKDLPGVSINGETTSLNTNLNLNLVHFYATPSNVTFNTTAGYQYESRDWNNVLVQAQGLVVTQENIDQASALNGFQTRLIQRERGVFFQEEVNIQEKFFLTGGFRADASSRIGDTDKFFFYPKASASIRLSSFDFWTSDFFKELKLRAAFGRTGNLPLARAKFTSLQAENISGLGGVLVPTLRGNADIDPEITQEFEFGVDATFWQDRATLELTYYTQDISDLILQNNLPPSSGFANQFINAGDMTTQGVEAGLGITPVRTRDFSWTSRINFFKSWSEITSLDVDPFEIGGFALSLGQFQIQEGESPTTIVGLDEAGNKTQFGDESPDFQVGFGSDISYKNFSLSFLWDWKQGGDVINLGRFLTDLGGVSPDLDTKAGQDRAAGVGGTGRYVEDGTYLKLREASLVYNVGRSKIQQWFGNRVQSLSFGVTGRNLIMITDYSGYDPEVSQFGNLAIGRSVDVIPFPSARFVYFKVSVGF